MKNIDEIFVGDLIRIGEFIVVVLDTPSKIEGIDSFVHFPVMTTSGLGLVEFVINRIGEQSFDVVLMILNNEDLDLWDDVGFGECQLLSRFSDAIS